MAEPNAGGSDPKPTDPVVDPNKKNDQDPSLEDLSKEFEKTLEDKTPEEQVDAYKEHNKQLFGRAKKGEDKTKTLGERVTELEKEVDDNKPPAPPKPDPKKTDDKNKLSVDDVLNLQAEGYSPAEIKQLQGDATKMGVPLSAYLENEVIKTGIEEQRKKKKAEEATPPPSNQAPLVKDKKWNELSNKEKDENYSEHVKNIVQAKRGR